MSVLRLIQLSDCHVSASRDAHYRGQHALDGLNSIVAACRDWRPDLVVASGDLSEDSSAESYDVLAEYFLKMGAEVFLLPGNHDDMTLMRSVFSASCFHLVPTCGVGSWRLYFLNSTVHGTPAGRVDPAVARELANQMNTQAESHAFVFLHHQPFLSGSAWIDKYPLMDAEDFRDTISGCKKLRAVAWGHIHHGWDLRENSVTWLGCPATGTNTLPNHEKFTTDERGPACRWLELSANGDIETGLLYGQVQS